MASKDANNLFVIGSDKPGVLRGLVLSGGYPVNQRPPARPTECHTKVDVDAYCIGEETRRLQVCERRFFERRFGRLLPAPQPTREATSTAASLLFFAIEAPLL